MVNTEDTESDSIVVEDVSSCRKTGAQNQPQHAGETLHTNCGEEHTLSKKEVVSDETVVDESCSSTKTEGVQDEQQIGEKVQKECTEEDASKVSHPNSEESAVEGELCGSENSEHVIHTERQSEPDVIADEKDSVDNDTTRVPETPLQALAMGAAYEKTEKGHSAIADKTVPDLEDERQTMEQQGDNIEKHESIKSEEIKIESPKEISQQILPTAELKEKFKLKIEHPKIYPRIEQDITADGQKPLTVDQLRSLYYNTELEHLDEFVDSFLQVFSLHIFFRNNGIQILRFFKCKINKKVLLRERSPPTA